MPILFQSNEMQNLRKRRPSWGNPASEDEDRLDDLDDNYRNSKLFVSEELNRQLGRLSHDFETQVSVRDGKRQKLAASPENEKPNAAIMALEDSTNPSAGTSSSSSTAASITFTRRKSASYSSPLRQSEINADNESLPNETGMAVDDDDSSSESSSDETPVPDKKQKAVIVHPKRMVPASMSSYLNSTLGAKSKVSPTRVASVRHLYNRYFGAHGEPIKSISQLKNAVVTENESLRPSSRNAMVLYRPLPIINEVKGAGEKKQNEKGKEIDNGNSMELDDSSGMYLS